MARLTSLKPTSLKTLLIAALLGFSAAACVSTPLPKHNAGIDYNAAKQITLDVSETLVINDAPMVDATDRLAKQFGRSPEDAMREWVEKRVSAQGTSGSLNVIIKDANFAVSKLPVQSGIKGYFKREQAERWDAYLNVLIALEGSAQQLPPAEITVNVRASQTLPEEASESERRQTYDSILNALLASFDREAQKQMDIYFRAYYQ